MLKAAKPKPDAMIGLLPCNNHITIQHAKGLRLILPNANLKRPQTWPVRPAINLL